MPFRQVTSQPTRTMQTSILSANTYFTPMTSRIQAVDDLQSYRDPRPDFSLLDTDASPAGRKVPTESDDRDDYSSDSERAEDDVYGEVVARSEEGGFEVATVTTIVTAKSLLTPTVSFGDPVVEVVATEPSETSGAGIPFGNEGDGKAEEGGLKDIEAGMDKLVLGRRYSNIGRGPNGGKPAKPLGGNDHGSGGRGLEPNESTDMEYNPAKFLRPNEQPTIQSDRFYSWGSSTMYPETMPRMQNQYHQPRYDLPTEYNFQCHSLPVLEQYFETRQCVAPAYESPQGPLMSGYLPENGYISVGTQPIFPPTVQHQQQLQSNFYPEALATTFAQCLNTENFRQATFPDLPQMTQPQYVNVSAPSYMPVYQQHEQGPFVTSVRTTLAQGIQEDPILIHDTCAEPQGTSAPSAVPVNAQPSSELDIILEWVGEQPETRPTPTALRRASPPQSWSESTTMSSGAYSNPDYPSLSPPGQYLPPPCIEFTPNATTTYSFHSSACAPGSGVPNYSSSLLDNSYAGVYPGRGLSNPSQKVAQLPAAPSPYGTSSPRSVPSAMEASPSQSATPGYDPSDEVRSRSSPGSDGTVSMISNPGSVSNSPSSVSEDGATILIGDDLDADRMALVAEAEAIANSFDELSLISQDSHGDTPLNVAMIDEQWDLAEALIRRMIKAELLRQIINVRNKLQQTPLCLAVICNKPLIVETLIENGADVNVHLKASDDYLGTKFSQPLHLAASRGHLWKQTLKKLLRATNIDLNAFNSDGKSALHCAIEGHGRSFKNETIDSKDTLRMLAEKGANLNQPDCGHEKTPLHYAIERRDVELVSRLLVLAMSFTPDRDHYSVAKMLEARTGNGNTALHLAASVDMDTGEHKKLIQQLMSKGADPSSKNSDGFLPRELTKNRAIVELLKGRTASGRSPNTDKKRNS